MNKKELVLGVVLTILIVTFVFVGWLPLANATGLVGVACLAWFFRKEKINRWMKVGLFLVLVPLAFWVASYEPEGFSYPVLFSLAGNEGEPVRFESSIDVAKGIAGFILLYLLWPKLGVSGFVANARLRLSALALSPMVIISVAIPALGLEWQPKPIEHILQFAAVNLLITCVAEEVFLRLLLQQNLRNAVAGFTNNHALQEVVPLLLVSLVFVAIHAGIDGAAVWVFALAGFLYGLSYTLSKNIFYPIAIHFSVNLIHFSWLTYPI